MNGSWTKSLAWLVTLSTSYLFAQESVTVVSFGGSYAKACIEGYHKAFEAETGIKINLEDYNGELAQLRAQVEAGAVTWDVVDAEGPQLVLACDEGLLEPIDMLNLPPSPDGVPAEDDYPPGTLTECGVGGLYYATIVAYHPEVFPASEPSKIEDFFDIDSFPGRRAVHRNPQAVLEIALMGDGVDPSDVYDALRSEAGVQRAFASLARIKDQIVWWEAGAQPPQMLADREVSMAIAWNGRIFNAQMLEDQPFKIMWDGRVVDTGSLVIVADAPNLANARKFVEFASRAESQAGVASHIAYAPVRYSGFNLVGNHAVTGKPMKPHLPTNPDHGGRSLTFDVEFWVDNRDELVERFTSWLSR
ncbi:MAG: ABC transporter substrate-binding protein [Gammaproteobacteria bacterium]|nr:ABC transporter substrate-binding protein [Gammaproteobacteria bacterium]